MPTWTGDWLRGKGSNNRANVDRGITEHFASGSGELIPRVERETRARLPWVCATLKEESGETSGPDSRGYARATARIGCLPPTIHRADGDISYQSVFRWNPH